MTELEKDRQAAFRVVVEMLEKARADYDDLSSIQGTMDLQSGVSLIINRMNKMAERQVLTEGLVRMLIDPSADPRDVWRPKAPTDGSTT